MKCGSYDSFFEVFANRIRFEIIECLKEKPMCVNDLCEKLGEEQSKVSHHLKRMADCHFVTVKQDGKKRYYTLNKETIMPITKLVEMHVRKYCNYSCHKKTKQ